MRGKMMRKVFFLLAIMMVLSLVNLYAGGQRQSPASGSGELRYPTRPITIIVPTGPGGGHDLSVRTAARFSQKYLGVEMIIENRQGGGNAVGHTYFVNSAGLDGYTIVSYGNSGTTVVPFVQQVAYDPVGDEVPIGRITNQRNVLVVKADSPLNTFEDFMRHARANRTFASTSGVNGIDDLTVRMMNIKYNTNLVPVAYDSGSEAILAVLSGEALAAVGTMAAATPQFLAGGVKILAFLTDQPDPKYPQFKTAIEMGYDVALNNSIGFAAKVGTDPAIIKVLENFLLQLPNDPEYVAAMDLVGLTIDPLGSEDFLRVTLDEIARVKEILANTN